MLKKRRGGPTVHSTYELCINCINVLVFPDDPCVNYIMMISSLVRRELRRGLIFTIDKIFIDLS